MNTEFRFWPPGPISCATSGRFVATLSSSRRRPGSSALHSIEMYEGLDSGLRRNDERLTFLAELKNAGTTETYLAMQ